MSSSSPRAASFASDSAGDKGQRRGERGHLSPAERGEGFGLGASLGRRVVKLSWL
jgi:hypothetical protein